jgi:Tfp pilus assembly protein FimT
VNTPPARGRFGGPGPLSPSAGLSAVELVGVLAILLALGAAVGTGVSHLRSVVSIRSAAAEVGAALYRARMFALTYGVNVGLKYRLRDGRTEWALYGDGNGNGVRSAEILSGVDRPIGILVTWSRNDVRPAIMAGAVVPDPDGSGRLTSLDDPIRFNRSDICSFSPAGECTPGSIYLWDGGDRMAVVRVYGRTGKIRTLYYSRGDRQWTR